MRGEGWRLTEASSLGLLFCHGRGQLRFLLLCLGGSPDSRGSRGNCVRARREVHAGWTNKPGLAQGCSLDEAGNAVQKWPEHLILYLRSSLRSYTELTFLEVFPQPLLKTEQFHYENYRESSSAILLFWHLKSLKSSAPSPTPPPNSP